jgi:hypothetical protein
MSGLGDLSPSFVELTEHIDRLAIRTTSDT